MSGGCFGVAAKPCFCASSCCSLPQSRPGACSLFSSAARPRLRFKVGKDAEEAEGAFQGQGERGREWLLSGGSASSVSGLFQDRFPLGDIKLKSEDSLTDHDGADTLIVSTFTSGLFERFRNCPLFERVGRVTHFHALRS